MLSKYLLREYIFLDKEKPINSLTKNTFIYVYIYQSSTIYHLSIYLNRYIDT